MIFCALLGPTLGFSFGFNFTLFRFTFLSLTLLFTLSIILCKAKAVTCSSVQELFQPRDLARPVRTYVYFFILWLSYGFISLLWAQNLKGGLHYLTLLICMLGLVYYVVYFIRSDITYYNLMKILLLAYVIIIGYGCFEAITLIHLPISRACNSDLVGVTSFFVNENDLATFITLSLPFVFGALFMLNLKRRYQILLYLLGVLALFLLFATGSRGNVLIACPLMVVALVIIAPRLMEKGRITFAATRRVVLLFVSAVFLAQVSFCSLCRWN